MKITKLQLENFRNYQRHVYEFAKKKDFTIFVGPNGAGKTNFLEAIYVLSLGKSFRSLCRDDLVGWNMDYMRCTCDVENDEGNVNLEVFYSNYPKAQKNFKKNGVNLKNSEYLGNLITVLFQPEDLNMLYLSPSLRRRYMDIILSQVDKKYLTALGKYKKILKQRNALLHEIREKRFKGQNTDNLMADLDVWDKEIIGAGVILTEKRLILVEFLSKKLSKIYRSISKGKDKIEVEYLSNSKMFKDEIFNRKSRDIAQAETTSGPHRDDLKFFINGKEISKGASRGEYRTLLLSIKLAEISFIKKQTGTLPVLLLDDVFSELDRKRQKHLLKSIKGCQTIITTTDINNLGELAEEKASIEIAN